MACVSGLTNGVYSYVDCCGLLQAGVSLGVVGYGSLISAMRIGEVSAITPFRYTRLIFGLSIGYFIFNEHVGINATIGCVLIVLSSFTVLYRGRTR